MQGKTKNGYLLISGIALITLRAVIQQFVDRGGHSSDATDFFFGLMFGVGIGLLLLFVWRLGRRNPPNHLA